MIDKTEWLLTGFSGSGTNGAFVRSIAHIQAVRNGSFVDLFFTLPGQESPLILILAADDLSNAVAGSHGQSQKVRVEMDVPVHSDAYTEIMERHLKAELWAGSISDA